MRRPPSSSPRRTPLTALSVVPTPQDDWSALLDRPDIAIEGGLLHVVHDTVTPEEARTADILLVAEALDRADIEVTLIRHDRSTPALVVDLDRRDAVMA